MDSLEDAIGNRKFSLTVEGTGAPSCYGLTIDYARNNGRVLLLGNPSRDVVLERATVSKILRNSSVFTARGIRPWAAQSTSGKPLWTLSPPET